jgi:YcaO cyclodehydratase, ATP-ad Mg2+-binding
LQYLELQSTVTAAVRRFPIRGKPKNKTDWLDLVPLSTSGFAAHLSEEQALESAIFEIVERDAFFIAWYGNIAAQDITDYALDLYKQLPKQLIAECFLKVLLLPTNYNSGFAVATLLIRRDEKGFIVGLGAATTIQASVAKAINEALYFYCWNLLFDPKTFAVSTDISKFKGYESNLDYFWHQGRDAYRSLLDGKSFELKCCQYSSDISQQLEVYRAVVARANIAGKDVCVVGAYIPTLIPQHPLAKYNLDLSAVRGRWPEFKQVWPLTGFHPFT